MLSYQHGYHAGSFADVIKHCALTRLLNYLVQKDKPLFYLDTHSGKGMYNLKDIQSKKTDEYKQGIQVIWDGQSALPPLFENYLQTIKKLNISNNLDLYPGSPYLALNLLRPKDRIYCCELHPTEFATLEKMPRLGKKIHFSNTHGINALNALLPPPEKRGLIFIDPSFEMKEEYKTIPAALKEAFKRFSSGIYCLWYPLVDKKFTEQLIRGMKAIEHAKALRVEFHLNPASPIGMTGCGLWIINPPFTFAQEMKIILDVLKTYFNPGTSSYIVEEYSLKK